MNNQSTQANSMIFSGAKVYTGNAVYENGTVTIQGDKITEVAFSPNEQTANNAEQKFVVPSSWHLIPGMIDIHLHGALGADVMDATSNALLTIAHALPQEGVTSFLATTMTQAPELITQAVQCINTYQKQQVKGEGAELLGVNLEGPFISLKKAAAQASQYIQKPNLALLRSWYEIIGEGLRIITIAPEVHGATDLIEYAVKHGVNVAVGHSDASYEEMHQAIELGCCHATHLFNAMPPLHHREPGAVLALLLDPSVTVELIADGEHLHPAILQMILKLKGPDKIILITDAMRAKGLHDGISELGGQKVFVKNNVARLGNGALAGSVLSLNAALRNMMLFTGCTMAEAVKMVTLNPAQKLGIAKSKGNLAVGKDADLVLLNENCEVMLTVCGGKIVYE